MALIMDVLGNGNHDILCRDPVCGCPDLDSDGAPMGNHRGPLPNSSSAKENSSIFDTTTHDEDHELACGTNQGLSVATLPT
jgi:hypothetical protein